MVKSMKYNEFLKKNRAIALVLSEEKIIELEEKMKNKKHRTKIEFNNYDDITQEVEFFIVGLCGYCPKNEGQRYVEIQNHVDILWDDIVDFSIEYNKGKKALKRINLNESNILYVEDEKVKKLKLDKVDMDTIVKMLENIELKNFQYKIHNPMKKIPKYVNEKNISIIKKIVLMLSK